MLKKRTILIAAVLLVVVAVIVLATYHKNSAPQGGKTPSKDALNAVQVYIQAQENSVGADQASPTSWINKVKSVTTASWFSKLQPVADPTTGTIPYNYTFAHQKNYVVKANLSGCVWDNILLKPSATRGIVNCSLQDETINKGSGTSIPASDLPFGWVAVGKQASPRLVLLNQNGKWLIDGDLTGQAL
jgi:hypothetical protein